jgi:hypothetical protein
MYALTLVAITVFAWGFLQRLKVYRLGKPLNRTDNSGARIVGLLKDVLLQTKVMTVRGPGIAHGLFFWGFFLLFIGTCLILLQADFTDLFFDIKFLKGTFYLYFSLILDLAGWCVLRDLKPQKTMPLCMACFSPFCSLASLLKALGWP